MEAKPWILKLGWFLSLPLIAIAAVFMIAVHILVTFCFSAVAAYMTIRSLYNEAPVIKEQS